MLYSQHSQFRFSIPSKGHNYRGLSWWMRDVCSRGWLDCCWEPLLLQERHTMRPDLQPITIHLSRRITIQLCTERPLQLKTLHSAHARPAGPLHGDRLVKCAAARDNAVELIRSPISTFLPRQALYQLISIKLFITLTSTTRFRRVWFIWSGESNNS